VGVIHFGLVGHGVATEIVPTVLATRCTAPCETVFEAVERGHLGAGGDPALGRPVAVVETRIEWRDDGTVAEVGSLTIGGGHVLRFASLGCDVVTTAPDEGVRHGTAILEVTGGSGWFARATGRLSSNSLIFAIGELTTYLVAVLFVPDRPETHIPGAHDRSRVPSPAGVPADFPLPRR
jgi:hypothetical protein